MSNTISATWGAATTDEAPEFSGSKLVEPGLYTATIEKAEKKTSNSSGKGYYNIQWSLDNNRKVFQPFYIASDNVEFVQRTLNALKRLFLVTGATMPTDIPKPSEMQTLVGRMAQIKVDIEEGTNGYNDKNVVLDSFPAVQTSQGAEIDDSMDIPFQQLIKQPRTAQQEIQ